MAEYAIFVKAAILAVMLEGGSSLGCQGMGSVALTISTGCWVDVSVSEDLVWMERVLHRSASSLNGLE